MQLIALLFATYNSVFHPVLQMGPYVAISVFALVLTTVYTIIRRLVVDQERVSELKEELQSLREQDDTSEEDDTSQMTRMMELQQKMMFENMKPMIFIVIISLLIFPWVRATYAPTISLHEAPNGAYQGTLTYADRAANVTLNDTQSVVQVDDQTTTVGGRIVADGVKWQVADVTNTKDAHKVEFNADLVDLPVSLPLAGDALNWLGFYVALSIPISTVLKKTLNRLDNLQNEVNGG